MINSRSTFSICLLLISFCANAQQNSEKLLKNTSWIQDGYDRCLKIADSTYTYYNINSVDCKVLVEGKLSERFKIVSLKKNELILNPGGIVNYVFRRVQSLPPVCSHPVAPTSSYEKNFTVFWETFDHNYAFFKERNLNWKQIYDEYLPRVKKISTQKEFADILVEIVKKIGDGHIRLEIPEALKTKVATAPGIKPETPIIKRLATDVIKDLQDTYLEDLHSYNNGVISWGKLRGTRIGYILIKDMNGFANYVSESEQLLPNFAKNYDKIKASRPALDQFEDEDRGVKMVMGKILSDIGPSDSLVIDLRFNGGGLETVALKLLSYFVTESKHVLSVKAKTALGSTAIQKYVLQPTNPGYKGKVYLLTGPNTASAAEIFALAARQYKNIKTVGSRTAGIFSEILWKELPNGWEFSLSNETYTDPKGKTYEATGVPVSYEMNYPRNRRDFYNDFYMGNRFIDLALDKISEK
jgi:hypothetical protein